ncbi:Cyclin-dependent kinase 10 [Mortierella sp. NVP85]|nr:Cyclin-dependent kinase 10 [Mortierella sp. NVP85]
MTSSSTATTFSTAAATTATTTSTITTSDMIPESGLSTTSTVPRTAATTRMTSSTGTETLKDNLLSNRSGAKEDLDNSRAKDDTRYIADNQQEGTHKGILTHGDAATTTHHTDIDITSTKSIDHRSSESRTQQGSNRTDGRSDNKRTGERTNTSGSNPRPANDHPSSAPSKQQDRTSNGHRNDRNRPQLANGGRDEKDKADSRERPNGGNREGGKDGAKDMEGRSRNQDNRHKDNRQQSQASRNNQAKDNAKDPDHKAKDNQQNNRQGNFGGEARPDPLSLLSITGRMGSLTPQRPFFGNSRIVDDFEKLNKVGEGTYGVVYRARDKRSNEIVALKRIRMERENDGLPISSLREIKLLKTLRHDNIVLVKDVAVGNDLDQIFLVMEYCEQDMAALMDNIKKPYTPAEVKCLMYQLLKGIEYCHDHFVIHRDLKLSNLLLNGHGILKIADFGLARPFGLPSRPMTPKVVTLWYRAPELLFGDQNYTTAVDMWSAGCIFGELLQHAPLLPGKVEKQQVDLMIDLLGTPHEKIWQGFNKLPMSSITLPEQRFNNLRKKFPNITDATRSLLSGLLTYDPKKRLTVKQALAHPYFIESPPAKHPSLLPTHPEIRNIQSTRSLARYSSSPKKLSANDGSTLTRSLCYTPWRISRDPSSMILTCRPTSVSSSCSYAPYTSLVPSGRLGSFSGDPYPESDLDFRRCKNPIQLQKSITSYLRSHPQPTEHALVAMLMACADLTRTALSSPALGYEQSKKTGSPRKQRHGSLSSIAREAGISDLRLSLLKTILDSSAFTSDEVFGTARFIYDNISTGSYLNTDLNDNATQPMHPSLQVTNAFLYVCALNGHFDAASAVLEDMMGRSQGDVKPDLTTFRHVLRAAHVRRQQLQDHSEEASALDAHVDWIIDHAAEALAKQTRMAFWIKLGLGGLVGATVGKFTMIGILVLPSSKFMSNVGESAGTESSTVQGSLQPTDGIIQLLSSQELAMGVGLAAGVLTAGYFIRGSTRQSVASVKQEPEPGTHSEDTRSSIRYQHAPQSLPRARLLGFYFPDLATTDVDEIRENLRSNMRV